MVPPWLRFHIPLIGRVEGWRAGRPLDRATFSSPLHVARSMRISRTARPHLLHATAYGTYPAGATFGPVASHSIGVKQPSSVVQPPPIPSFPAEALSFLSKSSEPPGRFSLRLDV